ncbi:hypothetical protein FQN60_004117 [Etheostoma spectabile]|uniref:Uncharacterized protein n=1 Tax=Etheostoma spectabile TaxID=54343 RepID=A0A5J5CX14_9PERO|nr:hypothetical protein FQN60_004117 [Etheostoma spectabile]
MITVNSETKRYIMREIYMYRNFFFYDKLISHLKHVCWLSAPQKALAKEPELVPGYCGTLNLFCNL